MYLRCCTQKSEHSVSSGGKYFFGLFPFPIYGWCLIICTLSLWRIAVGGHFKTLKKAVDYIFWLLGPLHVAHWAVLMLTVFYHENWSHSVTVWFTFLGNLVLRKSVLIWYKTFEIILLLHLINYRAECFGKIRSSFSSDTQTFGCVELTTETPPIRAEMLNHRGGVGGGVVDHKQNSCFDVQSLFLSGPKP